MTAHVTPASALMIDLEATELREQLPNLVDTLYEAPLMAQMVEMMANDVLLCSTFRNVDGHLLLDVGVLGVRVGAWRQLAQEALAITERP